MEDWGNIEKIGSQAKLDEPLNFYQHRYPCPLLEQQPHEDFVTN